MASFKDILLYKLIQDDDVLFKNDMLLTKYNNKLFIGDYSKELVHIQVIEKKDKDYISNDFYYKLYGVTISTDDDKFNDFVLFTETEYRTLTA